VAAQLAARHIDLHPLLSSPRLRPTATAAQAPVPQASVRPRRAVNAQTDTTGIDDLHEPDIDLARNCGYLQPANRSTGASPPARAHGGGLPTTRRQLNPPSLSSS
jgi:hypothetical protein